jgi:quercetin dioxygenase-like cupin family protein
MAQPDTGGLPAVSDLAGLLQYQEGSVVSRVLMKNAGGNVTLFAFDAGEGLSEHTAPFDALVVLLDGEAEVTIGGRPHRVAAGQTITMPASVPHALKALAPFKMLLVMLKS